MTPGAHGSEATFRHPALLYRADDEFLRGTLGFARAALAAGNPVLAAVPEPRLGLLRAELGDADVRLIDMADAGRNPGRILPFVLNAFADEHPGARVAMIGEPIWPGRTPDEHAAAVQHEALINLAFAGRPATILCPYDVERLDPTVIADAERTHPVLLDGDGERASRAYADPAAVATQCPLPRAPADADELRFDARALHDVRRLVATHALRAGLAAKRRADVQLAVHEIATNAVVHGGQPAILRLWNSDALVCEISDGGRWSDPLAGRRKPDADGVRGRGLLIANWVCDLVQVQPGPNGTTVRLHVRR